MLWRKIMKDNKLEKNGNLSVLGKIKVFFTKLFGKSQKYELLESGKFERKTVNNENKRENFMKQLKENINWVKELQIKFEKGEILEEDMTEEQKNALNKLYDEEINKIKARTEMKKKKLQELRKKSINKNLNYSRKLWQIKQAS